MSNIYVLHHDDSDGFASALGPYKLYGDKAKYIAVQYGQKFPDIPLTKDTEIIIVDFSYKRDILESVNEKVKSLLVIDHHDTAQHELIDLPYAIFDMTLSGATLAWMHFFPGERIPYMLRVVEDRDLWSWKLPESRAFEAGMKGSGQYRSLKYWNQVLDDPQEFALVVEKGTPIAERDQSFLNDFVKTKKFKVINFAFNGKKYKVALYNATTLISDLGSAIYLDADAGVDFTLSYFFTNEGKVAFSFRSNKHRPDMVNVALIAKHYGGGGHPNAAGANVPLDQGLAMLSVFYKMP